MKFKNVKTISNLFDCFPTAQKCIDAVDAELTKLIDKNPDFIYTDIGGCFYHTGPKGGEGKCSGCIFGQAFQALGVPKNNMVLWGGLINSKQGKNLPTYNYSIPDYWIKIQREQDSGENWGSLKEIIETKSIE